MNGRGFALAMTLVCTLAALAFVQVQRGSRTKAPRAVELAPTPAPYVAEVEEAPARSAPPAPALYDERGRPITGIPGDDD